ncbi:MAG: hypothetical protein JO086_03990 [Acidimicrobiia bacterium]|nr:hypothetical protein [Acidimicrobiia bacterium]
MLTNRDVTTGQKAAANEHWYRHRTEIEVVFRDGKLGAALRYRLPATPKISPAWMWLALFAASITG